MREILFRGKTKEGEWVYGNLIFMNTHPNGYDKPQAVIMPPTTYIAHGDIWGDFWFVDPETISMCSGFSDKHGRLIFEGDILAFSDRLVEVFWHAHLGCWDSTFLKFTNKENGRDDMSPLNWRYKSEVIGNIHDNPELLKGGAE